MTHGVWKPLILYEIGGFFVRYFAERGKNMFEIQGKVNTALCYAKVVEDEAIEQIRRMCDYEFTQDSKIRIMPDVHAGKGCTIGTTMTVTDKAVPNIVGVDIGCGMYTVNLGKAEIDFEKLDEAQDGTKYLVIHTGSRNLGKQVAEIYQQLAIDLNTGKETYFAERNAIIEEYKAAGKRKEIQAALKAICWEQREATMPEDLCFLYGTFFEDYLHDVEICQQFAKRNREKIAEILLERTGLVGTDGFHTIHNYIDTDEMILRKGAIAAHKGEKVLIPINMRDGSVLAVGKGNPDWNYSAPHGAGRLMSRAKAKDSLNMEEYKQAMEGIYTTSVSEATLDEAPMAYKSLEDIVDVIRETVDIIDIMKPIYNFKAN